MPRSPRPGQHGSFSPVSPYSPSPSYSPFASTPYGTTVFTDPPPAYPSSPHPPFINSPHPPFASSPYPPFASPPPPVFTGPPPSTYNVTYVYNSAPQPQPQTTETPHKNHDKVQLLGPALKVAAAVLVPLLTANTTGTTGIGGVGGW